MEYIGPILIVIGICGLIYAISGYIKTPSLKSINGGSTKPAIKDIEYKHHLENGKFTIKPNKQ